MSSVLREVAARFSAASSRHYFRASSSDDLISGTSSLPSLKSTRKSLKYCGASEIACSVSSLESGSLDSRVDDDGDASASRLRVGVPELFIAPVFELGAMEVPVYASRN